jgi:AcrR family transcriptional regulator
MLCSAFRAVHVSRRVSWKTALVAGKKTATLTSDRPRGKRDAEVLEAAVRVFYERGYSDATVQDVADEMNILKGSLYHYIKTKEDLLFRLFEEVHGDVQQIMQSVMEVEGLSALERLRLYVRRQVEYNLENIERISVYYADRDRLSGERLNEVRRLLREQNLVVTDLIERAQADGEIDGDRDARLLANCLFATIIWPYRWYRRGGRIKRADIVDTCEAFVVDGLGAKAA